MRYDEARSLILDGDLIAVKRRSGFLSVMTRLVTRSDYTHTGIAVWSEGRLLLAQANGGGVNFVPLSQECEAAFDVFDCPVDPASAVAQAWLLLGSRTHYGFADLARIALHLWLGVPLPKDDDGGVICSALSARIYQLAGWLPRGLPSIPWPGAVVAALGKSPRLVVDPA
jgi:hypothetical protein